MKSYNVARADVNQPEIVEALRKIGAYVKPIHSVKEFADLLVVFRGKVHILEIKYPEGKHKFPKKFFIEYSASEKRSFLEGILKPGELRAMREITAAGGDYHIVWDTASAIAAVSPPPPF